MSDHDPWNETRRLAREDAADDPAHTRRIDRDDADHTRRIDRDDADRTQHLGSGAGDGGGRTERLGPQADRERAATQYDAVGDSTYDDPYATGSAPPGYARTDYAADAPTQPVDEDPDTDRGDGWRSALMLLLGIGLGFVAALVVVAFFGDDGPDGDAIAMRDERIADLEEAVDTLETERAELEETLGQRDQQVSDLQARLEQAEDDAADEQEALDEQERSLLEWERELDQREATLDDRARELADRQRELEQRDQDTDTPGNGDNGDGATPPDLDLPDIDQDDADAFIDRVIDQIRDLFR